MKKIVLVLAVLMLAAPVMAEPNHITITATQVGSTDEVEITYAVTTGKIPRAFALDISVTDGNIIDVDGFFSGECNDSNGYGIFPASFAREIDADDPNWADVNYTPVAEPNDLPGGTLGLDPNGITIEMGSLYAAPKGPPENSGKLCSIYVDTDCHVDLALNVGRAGIVMEDGNQPDDITLNETDVTLEVVCTVPDVVGDTNTVAQAAIIAAGFTVGTITPVDGGGAPLDQVMAQNPAPLSTPGCGTAVDIDVSAECLKSSDPGYAAWVTFGKPDCWCYKKQCRGDINGTSAFGKPVSGVDNDLFKLAFNKTDAELLAITAFNGICADLNHTAAFGKRVTGTDNDTFKLYFNVAEASVDECSSTHINFWTN